MVVTGGARDACLDRNELPEWAGLAVMRAGPRLVAPSRAVFTSEPAFLVRECPGNTGLAAIRTTRRLVLTLVAGNALLSVPCHRFELARSALLALPIRHL
jgi:hypothetical protein